MKRLPWCLLALALVGCSAGTTATSSPTAAPLPMPPPTGDRRSVELEAPARYRWWPNSPPIEHGRPYRLTLYTHCWDTIWIDVDGSFWRVVRVTDHDGRPPLVYGDPWDDGVVEVRADAATYRSDRGDMSLQLERLSGPIEVLICA